MKNLLLKTALIALLTFPLLAQAQVCDPDTTLGSVPGLYPDSLPSGVVGQPYSTTINFILPQDTSVFGQTLQFCYFTLDSTVPALDQLGLTIDCTAPDCFFEIDHTPGLINRQCAVISGTPLVEIDTVQVFVTAAAGQYIPSGDTCVVALTLPAPYLVPFKIEAGAASVDELVREDLAISLFPNPTNGNSRLTFNMPEAAGVQIDVVDLMGRQVDQVFSGNVLPGTQTHDIRTTGLSKGIYLVRISLDGGAKVFGQRLIVSE